MAAVVEMVTYRQATPDDAATLALLRWEMSVEMRPEQEPPVSREEYCAAHVAEMRPEMAQGRALAWLAEVEGKVVGAVTLALWVAPPTMLHLRRRRGFVSSVYTRPAWRRRGVSRALMGLLIAGARAEGVDKLVLWASEMGRPVYEQLGFTTSEGMELRL